MTISIHPFTEDHWPEIWSIMEGVFRAGDSFPNAVDTTEAQGLAYWVNPEKTIYTALNDTGQVVGAYYIKANNIGIAAHICNGGYMVAADARGQGIATQLCRHSQDVARAQGYLGMQYNLVVSTNTGAVALWQKLGFEIVGAVPNAFRHKTLGLVDAYVMHKGLVDTSS